jgi:hypothetical protein
VLLVQGISANWIDRQKFILIGENKDPKGKKSLLSLFCCIGMSLGTIGHNWKWEAGIAR